MLRDILTVDNDIFLDFSKSILDLGDLEKYCHDEKIALEGLKRIECGEIENISENRMVGHYWLRDSEIAPSQEIRDEINDSISCIKEFSEEVLSGKILNEDDEKFERLVYIGIGGSALGPEFIYEALKKPAEKMKLYFLDNTDPESFNDLATKLKGKLKRTLFVVVSKSGGTKETSNVFSQVEDYFKKRNWNIYKNSIAITMRNSVLDEKAKCHNWLKIFYIWDWVGGRTSISSAVGLLPMALIGGDIESFLQGMRYADKLGRRGVYKNPSLLMALELIENKKIGKRQLVVLPYKDRLSLFGKYLQQLMMESLGKYMDQNDNIVKEGIAVFGNKGSSDQHSYLQQLFDGPNNFTVNFIDLLKIEKVKSLFTLEDGNYVADYLKAFQMGTQKELYDKNRNSVSITLKELNEFYLGFLIALYERVVSFYGVLANINAYDQPAVERGKKAATGILDLKKEIMKNFEYNKTNTVGDLAQALQADGVEVFKLLEYMRLSQDYPIEARREGKIMEWEYTMS